MKLYIRQKLLRLTDTYDIYDESGKRKYFAECDFTLFLHRLRVYEGNEEFGLVQQELSLFLPKFEFHMNNEYLGSIIKEFTLFFPSYRMDFNGWRIDGDFFDLDYDVYDQNGKIIMSFQKELISFTDEYYLDIKDEKYERLCVLIALAVDMAICSQKK